MLTHGRGRLAAAGLAFAALVLGATGCSRSERAQPARIRVFATARARDTIDPLVAMYERRNPDVRVATTYGNPPDLQGFLAGGDRPNLVVDNFISAVPAYSPHRADGTTDASLGSDELRIVTPVGNPGAVGDLGSLGSVPRMGLCSTVTVCGVATDQSLAGAGVVLPSATRATGPDLALSVAEGNLDAAIVFGSDVPAAARDRLASVPLDPAVASRTDYDVMTVTPTQATDRFRTWMTTDPEARAYLERHGLRPGAPAATPGDTS